MFRTGGRECPWSRMGGDAIQRAQGSHRQGRLSVMMVRNAPEPVIPHSESSRQFLEESLCFFVDIDRRRKQVYPQCLYFQQTFTEITHSQIGSRHATLLGHRRLLHFQRLCSTRSLVVVAGLIPSIHWQELQEIPQSSSVNRARVMLDNVERKQQGKRATGPLFPVCYLEEFHASRESTSRCTGS